MPTDGAGAQGHAQPLDSEVSFVIGGGETGQLVRSLDWSSLPLGSPRDWPQSLRTAIDICLSSRFPIALYWGPQFLMLYNDDLLPMVGANKHPWAMGRPAQEVLGEIWSIIGPLLDSVVTTGKAIWSEDLMLPLLRSDVAEESYFTFTYSPVRDESGRVGGVLCAVLETTDKVIEERRLRLLNALANATHAKTTEDACAVVAAELAQAPNDVPFALVYLLDESAEVAKLVGHTNIEPGTPRSPVSVRLDDDSVWPFGVAFREQRPELVKLDGGHAGARGAVVLPIERAGGGAPFGFIVAGLSPLLRSAESYARFHNLLAASVSQSVSGAAAYEQEKKRAESLTELDRAKTAFFSNVSHEFRTPLTLMLAPIQDMLALPAGTPTDHAAVELLYRNALRLLKLVNTLLEFSRIEAGRVDAVYAPVDLAALTAQLASSFRAAVERAGLELLVDCPPLAESIYVDREMWEKIVLNLLSNAFKFTFQGSITVRLRMDEAGARLEVADTGTGIEARELPRLFERFHRIEGVRSRSHEGSGIGLALIQELIRLHGGEIHVISEVGVGTTFQVRVPRGSAHLAQDRILAAHALASTTLGPAPYVLEADRLIPAKSQLATPAPAKTIGSRDRIVFADDNADMREYVGRLLGEQWEVETVSDGGAVLAAIRRAPPALLVSDVMMPVLDGFALVRALRSDPALRSLPIILLSARAGDEATETGLGSGADDYLVKPFSARELVARVTTQIALGRARRAIEDLARREESARRTAEDASRAKDEFLSTLSHELRTPLNAVVGWSSLLRSGGVAEKDRERALDTIERNARAQAKLIEDLLDLSRITQGKLVIAVGPVEVVRVVEAALDAVRLAADAKNVRLQPVLDSHATIVGDADRLQQVVWNLLSNAIKFTPKNGRVQVRVRRTESYVEVAVADNGQGIAHEFLPHVFDRFRQADGGFNRHSGGLGLGLAIVRSLVELHGGTVAAASDGLGKGATFTVRVPMAPLRVDATPSADAEPSVPSRATFECPPALRGRSVLIVDDEPDTRELLAFLLSQCEMRVTQAAGATEALAALHRERFDVLISDIGMPGEDGMSLIRKVRKLPASANGQIPALALTAYARSEDRNAALKAGFQMHLTKPIQPTDLLVTVATLVGGYAAGD